MAQISINIDGENNFQKMSGPDDTCLMIDMSVDLKGEFGETPYQRDRLYLHGNPAAMRAFAEGIISALPAESPVVEPEQAQIAEVA